MEDLNKGNWCFMGIRAEAEYRFVYMTEGKGGRDYYNTQKLTSGGLWGLESDMDKGDWEYNEKEQLAELRTELKALGFSSRAISTAFKTIERKDQ